MTDLEAFITACENGDRDEINKWSNFYLADLKHPYINQSASDALFTNHFDIFVEFADNGLVKGISNHIIEQSFSSYTSHTKICYLIKYNFLDEYIERVCVSTRQRELVDHLLKMVETVTSLL